MLVIKIKKSYRNGVIEHILVLSGDDYDDDYIDYYVNEWCENNSAGSVYGYSYEWEIVLDEKIIEKALKNKIKLIDLDINSLKKEKKIYLNFL